MDVGGGDEELLLGNRKEREREKERQGKGGCVVDNKSATRTVWESQSVCVCVCEGLGTRGKKNKIKTHQCVDIDRKNNYGRTPNETK